MIYISHSMLNREFLTLRRLLPQKEGCSREFCGKNIVGSAKKELRKLGLAMLLSQAIVKPLRTEVSSPWCSALTKRFLKSKTMRCTTIQATIQT